jgi:hypothetical protein
VASVDGFDQLHKIRILTTRYGCIVQMKKEPSPSLFTDEIYDGADRFGNGPSNDRDDERHELHQARSSDPCNAPALPLITWGVLMPAHVKPGP